MNQGIGFANNPPLQFLQLTVVNADFAPIIFPRSKWLEKTSAGFLSQRNGLFGETNYISNFFFQIFTVKRQSFII